MDQPQEASANKQTFETMLERMNPDLYRVYRALSVIIQYGGNGSVEIHYVKGKIRLNQGLYIKPGISDDSLADKKRE